MSQKRFAGKTAQTFVVVIIGIIILSFILTSVGTGSLSTAPGSVAQVGNYPISIQEYQMAYNQIQQQYNQIFQGQSIPPALSSTMQKSAIMRLVNQKTVLNLSDELSFSASTEEVKETIKKQPYFLTDKQFDFSKYKELLKANRMTPKSYEETMLEDLKTQKFYTYLSQIKTSESFSEDLKKIKTSYLPIDFIKVDRYALRDHINVSSQEIDDYIKDTTHEASLKAIYQENISKYQKPALYTYRTLFLSKLGKKDSDVKKEAEEIKKTLNARNFAEIVSEKSDDSMTKLQGGLEADKTLDQIPNDAKKVLLTMKEGEISSVYSTSLGYNITYLESLTPALNIPLEKVNKEMAKIAIQRSKTEELTKLYNDVSEKAKLALSMNNQEEISKIVDKYSLEYEANSKLNIFTLDAGSSQFTLENLAVLKDSAINSVKSFDKATHNLITKVKGKITSSNQEDSKNESLGNDLQGKITRLLMQSYQEKHPVSYNPNFQLN